MRLLAAATVLSATALLGCDGNSSNAKPPVVVAPAEGPCADAGLTGDGLDACQAYSDSECTPDSVDEQCSTLRSRFFEATGQVALPSDCAAAAAAEEAFLKANPPPAPEPFTRAVLPVPTGVDADSVTDLNFHPDGDHLIWAARLTGESGFHIMTSRIDGSEYNCLTCPLGDLPFVKLDVFSDGRRVVVGNQVTFGLPSPLPYPSPFPGAETVPILECTPSLLDCQTPELVFVRVPFDPDDPALLANQRVREFRIAPDGVHLAWTQIRDDALLGLVPVTGELRRETDHYELDNVEVLTPLEPAMKPRADGGFDFSMPHAGEIKRFLYGGSAIALLSEDFAINADAGDVDIATGQVARLTHHPDYDEPIDVSPDGRWLVVGSKRSLDPAFDVTAAFGLVPRPNFMILRGSQLVSTWAFAGNNGLNRGLETWLVDRLGARGDYIGQNLSDDICYGGRERQHWNADGTRVAKREQIRPVMADDPRCHGLPTRRLVVYELTSRTPVPPAERFPIIPTPDAPWAGGITDVKNRPGIDTGLYTVPGRVFGEALVELTADTVSAEYRNYSDDGLVVLDGVESFTRRGVALNYPADLTVSGCQVGFVRSSAAWDSFVAPLTGEASSQLGDAHFDICAPGVQGVDCP
jgi:hypothetical protein